MNSIIVAFRACRVAESKARKYISFVNNWTEDHDEHVDQTYADYFRHESVRNLKIAIIISHNKLLN